jgi:hypothetical protein
MQDDRLIYSFRTADLRGEGRVIFRHKYDSYGWLRFKVGLPPGPSVAISQFVWP